jgi:hypothetical protein
MNDQIKFGGCPFCGSQSCVAGQCRMEMPNIDDILNQEIVRETLLEINPLADDALVEQMWALCKGNPWDAVPLYQMMKAVDIK